MEDECLRFPTWQSVELAPRLDHRDGAPTFDSHSTGEFAPKCTSRYRPRLVASGPDDDDALCGCVDHRFEIVDVDSDGNLDSIVSGCADLAELGSDVDDHVLCSESSVRIVSARGTQSDLVDTGRKRRAMENVCAAFMGRGPNLPGLTARRGSSDRCHP